MEGSKPIRLKIITPEDIVYDQAVNHVVLPGLAGDLGIFHNHVPFMSFLRPGRLKIHLHDKEKTIVQLDLKSGLFKFRDDTLTILTKEGITEEKLQGVTRPDP